MSLDGDRQLPVPSTPLAGMCCGVVGETTNTPATSEHSGGSGERRRRRMEIEQIKFIATAASNIVMPLPESNKKRRKVESRSCDMKPEEVGSATACLPSSETFSEKECSRFGLTVVHGRRRDLEDAVAVKPSFCKTSSSSSDDLHFYGVYDGHGCSHVALMCKDRMHCWISP